MRSLFIVSLPRSLSTRVHALASAALDLKQPSWVFEGEVLNLDRMVAYQGPRVGVSAKFTIRAHDPPVFQRWTDFLDLVARPEGYVYKDVIQPFIVSAWPGLSSFQVLRIERPIADVAWSMLDRGWFYPVRVAAPRLQAPLQNDLPPSSPLWKPSLMWTVGPRARAYREHLTRALIDGLLQADLCLATVNAMTVRYDDLVQHEDVLADALRKLYPDHPVSPIPYIEGDFSLERDAVLARRTTQRYRWIEGMARELEESQAPIPVLGS